MKKTKPKSRNAILAQIECKKSTLTPRKEKLYLAYRQQLSKVSNLKKKLLNSKDRLQTMHDISYTKWFNKLENNLDPAGVNFIKSQFSLCSKKKPRWTHENKVFALALFKNGPKCYRLLSNFLRLPSRSTLQKFAASLPFDTGVNEEMMRKLETRVSTFTRTNKNCVLTFDEISLSTNLHYCKGSDKIIGFQDLGTSNRKNILANHALVFMIHGIRKMWKQPVSYFFVKNLTCIQLKKLIADVIISLHNIGLSVACSVCDQATTNSAAIKRLQDEVKNQPGPFFDIHDEKIFTFFDPPHALKNTRTAFFNYDITYMDSKHQSKTAKFKYLQQTFDIDQTKRYQGLPGIQRSWLEDLDSNSMLKMKVSIAAKTMSHRMSSTIEDLCKFGGPLPMEAMDTADFVHDINDLFDSFNGQCRTEPTYEKDYRTAMSNKSLHERLWNEMVPKIHSWQYKNAKGICKNTMPSKAAWLHNISAIRELWRHLQKKGFKYLRTRAINQDPLENLFASIRQNGGANSNPSCYQFIYSLKTSVLNNLILKKRTGKNCEDDERSVLHDLRDFLSNNERTERPIVQDKDNEFLHMPIPEFDPESFKSENFDTQGLTYVCGYVIKRIRILECEQCRNCLLSSTLDAHHSLTYLREHCDSTTKKRLQYASYNMILYVAQIYDLTMYFLKAAPHVLDIKQKMVRVLTSKVSFDWFTCQEHFTSVKLFINKLCFNINVFKFCAKIEAAENKKRREKRILSNLKKTRHL